ncbi:hypothetical protein DE146DRAFT_657993 [Phaeosphaeria sp. MPI-PUGE-AT-0046c]|nr:hypothetical protein DE146DRAFT_657993 [Phaeosphaeria sp. MPI-PUGE-AT-0046c]
MSTSTKAAVIIGGSIAGLMHGVVLKSLGYNVCVIEARDPDQLKAQAAGLSLGPSAKELMETYLPNLDTKSYSMSTAVARFLAADGTVISENKTSIPVVCSTWGIVFEHLKNEFLKPLESSEEMRYLTGTKATHVSNEGDSVKVAFQSQDGLVGTILAHLIIVADGAFSTVRQQLVPSLVPQYANIVAWRGYIPETRIPTELEAVFDGKLLMFRADGSYLIAYLTPGPNGNGKGERLLDWVWYDACSVDSQDFRDTMTDMAGRQHRVTVPRDAVSTAAWASRVLRARKVLPSPWQEMVVTSESPFVTAITGFESEKAVFFEGKLLLAGDALTQFRPHLGSSCNLPALQALKLIDVLAGKLPISKWENEIVSYSKEFAARSIAAGQFGITGAYPQGYIPLYQQNQALSL